MLDGRKVKEARKAAGLNGRAFARLVGVSPSTITKIEDNDYPGIKLDLAECVALALHRHLCTLLKETHGQHQHGEGGQPWQQP